MDKATIVRMVETLITEGYVVKETDTPAYQPTRKVLELSRGYSLRDDLSRAGRLVLNRYSQKVDWPLTVAVQQDGYMQAACTSKPVRGLTMIRDPNYLFPMLATSVGLVYFSFLPEDEREALRLRLIEMHDPIGWNKLAHDPVALGKTVEKVRADGYALSDPEFMQHQYDGKLWAVAVPLVGPHAVHGAISNAILASAFKRGEALDKYLPIMETIARDIVQTIEGSEDERS